MTDPIDFGPSEMRLLEIGALQERVRVLEAKLALATEALEKVIHACHAGRERQLSGVTGMTVDAQLRNSVIDRVPAYPIEEAFQTLQELDQ